MRTQNIKQAPKSRFIRALMLVKGFFGSKFGTYWYIPLLHRKQLQEAMGEIIGPDKRHVFKTRVYNFPVHEESYEAAYEQANFIAQSYSYGKLVKVIRLKTSGTCIYEDGQINLAWEALPDVGDVENFTCTTKTDKTDEKIAKQAVAHTIVTQ